jgi:hypothetical protein
LWGRGFCPAAGLPPGVVRDSDAPKNDAHPALQGRLAIEKTGTGLRAPVVSIPPGKADEHFGMFAHFATLDMPASSEWTRKTLGWEPTGPGIIENLTNMKYF